MNFLWKFYEICHRTTIKKPINLIENGEIKIGCQVKEHFDVLVFQSPANSSATCTFDRTNPHSIIKGYITFIMVQKCFCLKKYLFDWHGLLPKMECHFLVGEFDTQVIEKLLQVE